jgi:hypothetical protein
MSSTVFVQLLLAVIQGLANHMVQEVEDTKDGYASWQALSAWHEESDLDHETLDALQTKMTRLYLDAGGSASNYINCFQTHNCNLDGINDGAEKYLEGSDNGEELEYIRAAMVAEERYKRIGHIFDEGKKHSAQAKKNSAMSHFDQFLKIYFKVKGNSF